jgi:ABC-type branched-subunit amino acid transport system substrate-binding protein
MQYRSRALAVIASATLVAAVAACASSKPASVPGVTSTTITVGSHQPLTGPAAPGYSKISPATAAYFAYVNANGGVNGRKIVYKVLDDGYNPNTTQTDVKQLVLKDHVFAILNGLGTPTHTSVLPFLKQNKVPDLFVASGSETWNQPSKYPDTYGFQVDYKVEGKILGNYVKTSMAGQKVCFFGQNDDFGADMLAGLQQEIGASAVAAQQQYDPAAAPNVGPQIGALKAAGCQVVVAATIPGFTALALGTAAKLGFKTQWIVSNVGTDYNTVAGLLGAAGTPLLEGVITDGYLPLASDTADPWITLFQKINTQYNNNAAWDGNVEYGMAVGYAFVQALKAAGKNPTRDSILSAINSQGKSWTGPGIVPLNFSSGNHSGYAGARIAKITGGVAQWVGPAYTTDDGSGAVTAYNGTEGTPSTNGIPSN